MGNGFAFVAQQKHFEVGNSDFYTDLILYNIPLHAYVVIELKATPFKPEYMGQLNFYINVVDNTLRGEHDNKTIGLLLCKMKRFTYFCSNFRSEPLYGSSCLRNLLTSINNNGVDC